MLGCAKTRFAVPLKQFPPKPPPSKLAGNTKRTFSPPSTLPLKPWRHYSSKLDIAEREADLATASRIKYGDMPEYEKEISSGAPKN